MTDIHEQAAPAMHRTRYHVIPLAPGRESVLDERTHPTAAHAAHSYSRDLHYQQLPATEPGDLLYTELVYAGRLATAQWWTADSAGLRKITEDQMLSMLGDQLTSDTETFLRLS